THLTTLPHKFPEHLAYHAKTNLLIWAAGKHAGTLNLNNPNQAQAQTLQAPSTIGGIALSPLGPRLAISHYGGASIYNLQNLTEAPRKLPWQGSHLGLTYSPNGKWLISSMQDQSLHLWRLSDGHDLQMRGYPGPISQFSFSHCGNWLGTNGGSGVPLWNFANKEKGPAGQQAKVVADSGSPELLVTSVVMHPQGPFMAVGYADGLALLVNYATNTSVLLHHPTPPQALESPQAVTHASWTHNGLALAFIQPNSLHLTHFSN
ncbi:MAG: WD40 repeat domain-containing protein, partial [Proteobacteria bacterium]|nr:WD40 repeat domain-containing protein [Pseudomonadota bacterium]